MKQPQSVVSSGHSGTTSMGENFKYPSDFDNEVSSGIWSIQSRSLHLPVKGLDPELDVFFKEASLRCRGRTPEQLAMALGGRAESLGLPNAWGSSLVSALISHLPGWDLPDRNFLAEVWDGVIGTSLKPKEVGASGWLALVPHQCSDCKEGRVGGCGVGRGMQFMSCCFLRVVWTFLTKRWVVHPTRMRD